MKETELVEVKAGVVRTKNGLVSDLEWAGGKSVNTETATSRANLVQTSPALNRNSAGWLLRLLKRRCLPIITRTRPGGFARIVANTHNQPSVAPTRRLQSPTHSKISPTTLGIV